MPFDDLPEPSKHELLLKSEFDENELGVITCYFDKSNWLLITTNKIVWSTNDNTQSLENKKIKDVTIGLSLESHKTITRKEGISHLGIIDLVGKKYSIKIEPGKPLFAIWNVMKYL